MVGLGWMERGGMEGRGGGGRAGMEGKGDGRAGKW